MRFFLLLLFLPVLANGCRHHCKKCDIDQLDRSFDVVWPPGEGDTFIDYEFRKNFKLAERCGIVSTCKYFIAYQFADGTFSTQHLKEKQEDLLPVSCLNGTWMLNSDATSREITGLKCYSSGTQRCEDFVNEDYHCYWGGCVDALNITTSWAENGLRRFVFTCPENTKVAWIFPADKTKVYFVSTTSRGQYCPADSIWKQYSLFCLEN